jgi:hypothetical protein
VIAVLIQHPGDIIPTTSWFTVFIGSWGTRHKEQEQRDEIAAERHRKTRNLSPDELLAKSPRNSQIRFKDITTIEIKRNIFFQYSLRFVLTVDGKRRTINFGLNKDHATEARQLLQNLLPSKFKGK